MCIYMQIFVCISYIRTFMFKFIVCRIVNYACETDKVALPLLSGDFQRMATPLLPHLNLAE